MTTNASVRRWVKEVARMCGPVDVVWCDGSEAERERLLKVAVRAGDLIPLDQRRLPGCYLHRSDPNDVARTEHLTFICCREKDDAGPTNNWIAPAGAYDRLSKLLSSSMEGRTMYVIPFVMGPPGSHFSKVGIQVTDSVYVVLNMRMMTRMGAVAWEQLGPSDDFTRGLHSTADLSADRRYICHFPEDNTIWSVGSGYGGNALLSKKCMSLRIASHMGHREGWLAEHMLIIGVESPDGEVTYICGAFPSACGKTNLSMLVPPASMKGWRVYTLGDDIAWLRVGPDGRLWAVNPEAGFFGVVPGTSSKTNPNAMAAIQRNTLYTNVALRPDGTVWWEGHDDPPPRTALDWRGRPWTSSHDEPAAHPNSRFTTPGRQCPSLSPEWENPKGVPISAILFGSRRQKLLPLVYQASSWQHGTFLGATLASETTAAITGAVGVVRRDPMAMLAFCGYNMADYWAHWLSMEKRASHLPKIFRVNWFRRDEKGRFLWPGFGENLRVLKWVIERCRGDGEADETPIGYVPTPSAIGGKGLDVSKDVLGELLRVDREGWRTNLRNQAEFFTKFEDRLPAGIREEHEALARRLKAK
ncbi:MAG: phosphoenolpyruvate carboxykinase, phosphoenolpyruvate carboxykinase (GTP) [candidate division NC10 bacterium CSP1-5]|nr:MAG: phosphoenolpyruvate carboxykinase, phosphoenolpyruvate carboxykinase (GTP) [candidate division NC10 bacterium CSP1-5]